MRVEDAPTRQDVLDELASQEEQFILNEWHRTFDQLIKAYGIDHGETRKFRIGGVANKEPRLSKDMKRVARFKRTLRMQGWEDVEAVLEEPLGSELAKQTWLQWLRREPSTYVKNGWERSNRYFYISIKRPEVVEQADEE